MGRKPSNNRVYTLDRIGVTPAGSRGFRVRWVEDGVKQERTA